jgi:hypothetical protein
VRYAQSGLFAIETLPHPTDLYRRSGLVLAADADAALADTWFSSTAMGSGSTKETIWAAPVEGSDRSGFPLVLRVARKSGLLEASGRVESEGISMSGS